MNNFLESFDISEHELKGIRFKFLKIVIEKHTENHTIDLRLHDYYTAKNSTDHVQQQFDVKEGVMLLRDSFQIDEDTGDVFSNTVKSKWCQIKIPL